MARSYALCWLEAGDMCGDAILKTLDRLRQLLQINGFGKIT
jgi:hypothetical protein